MRILVLVLGGVALPGCAAVPRRAPAPPPFGASLGAAAQGEDRDPRAVQPERPSVATHAGTVAPGFLELETGVEHDRNGDATTTLLVPTLFKFGLAPRAQLSVQLPLERSTGVPFGVGDVAAGVKWRIAGDDPSHHRFALQPSVKFSTGGARGTETVDATLLAIDSRTIGSTSVDINVGVTWRGANAADVARTTTFWTVASGTPLFSRVGWQLECFGYPGTGGPAGAAPSVAILTGPTLTLVRELAFDAGFIVPVTGPQPRAFYVGLVANLGRLIPATLRSSSP